MSNQRNPMDRRTFLKVLSAAGASAAVVAQAPLAAWASPQPWAKQTAPTLSLSTGEKANRDLKRVLTAPVQLAAVDTVDITILVDSFVDMLLPSTEMVQPISLWSWELRMRR